MTTTLDLEELADTLAALAMQTMLQDNSWRAFGFRKRPRRGAFFDRFVNRARLAEETALSRELVVLVVHKVMQWLVENLPEQYATAALGRLLQTVIAGRPGVFEIWKLLRFPSEEAAMEYVEDGLREHLYADDSPMVVARRMGELLTARGWAKWLVGAEVLLAVEESPLVRLSVILSEIPLRSEYVGRSAISRKDYFEAAYRLYDDAGSARVD